MAQRCEAIIAPTPIRFGSSGRGAAADLRRLLLSSDLMLDSAAVLQQAMGSTDSHLHQFLASENKMDRFAITTTRSSCSRRAAEGVLGTRFASTAATGHDDRWGARSLPRRP